MDTLAYQQFMNNYQPPIDLLNNRVILITGAGQGLGKAAALKFAEYGATVVLHGKSTSKLETVYDEIEAAGYAKPAIIPLDLEKATSADFEGLANSIKQELGRLDGILHNAAHLNQLSLLELQTSEQWLTSLKINLVAPFALTRACLPLLKTAKHASVIFTLDSHGRRPAAYWGSFAIAKHGLEALIQIWKQEWEVLPQLRINGIIPGPVHSPQRSRTHPAELKDALPKPQDLMSHYLYLMGHDSSAINGQILDLEY